MPSASLIPGDLVYAGSPARVMPGRKVLRARSYQPPSAQQLSRSVPGPMLTPVMGERIHIASGVDRSAAPARCPTTTLLLTLLLAVGLGLGGCSKNRFEFVVTDEGGAPLEGVEVVYQIESQGVAQDVMVGQTDASGSIVVTGKHFSAGRQYLFRKSCVADEGGKRFDPSQCAVITGGGGGQYTFALRDGLVRRPDLAHKLPGRKWPGRSVKLTCEATSDGTGGAGRQQSLTRILDLTAPAGASVSVNDRPIGTVPETGWLNTEFCPGDSADCFANAVAVTVSLAGYTPRTQEAPLPEPLGTVKLSVDLPRGGGTGTTSAGGNEQAGAGASPAATPAGDSATGGLAQVRIENRGTPFACGADGDRLPVVLVNDRSTVVRPSPASTDWKTYFDLLLKPGQSYCIAVRCPDDEPGALSWNPWDSSRGEATWYTIRIPADATRLFFAVPANEAGRNLKLTPVSDGSWKGFQTSRAVQVTRGCERG